MIDTGFDAIALAASGFAASPVGFAAGVEALDVAAGFADLLSPSAAITAVAAGVAACVRFDDSRAAIHNAPAARTSINNAIGSVQTIPGPAGFCVAAVAGAFTDAFTGATAFFVSAFEPVDFLTAIWVLLSLGT